ncbi:MAG: hypothetical protein KF774_21375 [Planctomyces sp.]|nr:hypothetical protein [Planctomyces sp.]
MASRFSTLAARASIVGAVVLMSSLSLAHWYELGPSANEWGLKYEGAAIADGDKLNVRFTLTDQGRLKPIHSVFVIAMSKPDRSGSRNFLAKTPIAMKPTKDGTLTGQIQVGKELADLAVIRIFTYTVDGKSQNKGPTAGARYYDVPLKNLVKPAPLAAVPQSPSTSASPSASRSTK